MLNKLAYFAGGLILGGVAGYLSGKYIAEERARAEVDAKMAELEDFYKKRDESRQKAHELNELKEQFAEQAIAASSAEEGDELKVIDYSKFSDGAKADQSDDDEWGDAPRPKGAPKRGQRKTSNPPDYREEGGAAVYPSEPESEPHIISEQSFAAELVNEKITLIWFTGDNVVTDEEYQPIEDLGVIGDGWQEHFGEEEDPDVIHVRNPKINVDYEIIRDNRSYATTLPE